MDDFPRTREQFTAMIERNILPDEVICLRDDSDNGEFLLKRWYQTNKEGKYEVLHWVIWYQTNKEGTYVLALDKKNGSG